MLTRSLLLRIASPTLLVSLLFLGSCLSAALYLNHRQTVTLQNLHENLASHRIAADLLRTTAELATLPENDPAQTNALHERIGELLIQAQQFANQREEVRLVGRLEERFGRILQEQRAAASEVGDRKTRCLLEVELVPLCRELERFKTAEVQRSEAALQRTVTGITWGLVGVGLLGTLAAVLSSYAMARSLGRAVLRAEELAEVGQIAAGLAHELRNPLTSIKMLVQVDREKVEARGLPSDDLYAIEQEIRRMEERLNTFMDFAKPPRPERRLLNLVPVVEQTLALIGGRARKQRVELRFDRPEAPLLAEVDGEQIRQLLVNLALNALDVMPRGGILKIELHFLADGQVELHVLDTGPGIAPKHISRLYESFFTSKETGLGLGLAVSQRIARDHGGSLRAWNRPEGGACFVLRLPARTVH